jgi:hypothetical protein
MKSKDIQNMKQAMSGCVIKLKLTIGEGGLKNMNNLQKNRSRLQKTNINLK